MFLGIIVVCLAVTSGQALDLTLTANESGRDVVAAVVDRIRNHCLITDDRFLLRRLAYVETRDGEASDTYRPDYHGGIWKVDSNMFYQTSSCLYPIQGTCDRIQSAFGINWRQVTWSDLRKPLYSGLAATLYILSQNVNPLPQNTASQALFWKNQYRRTSLDQNVYISASQEIRDIGCSDKLDLAFILDGSGSIQPDEFEQVKEFVKNVVNDFDVSKDGVQVALVEFSDSVGDVIHLNRYSDKVALNDAITSVRHAAQTTNTAAAFRVLTSSIYTSNEGARRDAKRVTVLLTDGASGDTQATKEAARIAKEKGIVVFTVGVGFVNEDELRSVASEPNCTHFYKLRNFDEIDHLVYEIKRRSCGAPKVISSKPGEDTPSTVTTPLKDDPVSNTFVINTTTNGTQKVIKTEVECGILKIYASYDTPNPGPAFYTSGSQAVDGRPSITKVNTTRDGKPLYVTVIGTKLTESCSDVLKCQDAKFSVSVVDPPSTTDVNVVCRTWEGDRPCTQAELVKKGFLIPSCPSGPRVYPVRNPCSPIAVASSLMVHPHPYDVTKFIVCDNDGRMYQTTCPNNGIFNPSAVTCNNNPIFSLPKKVQPTSTNFNYKCAHMLIPSKMYFPHPDPTKFIQCSLYRVAYVRDCGPGTVYNDALQNCAHVAGEAINVISAAEACRNAAVGAMLTYPGDSSKYIHCSGSGASVMPCPVGTRWYDVRKRCDFVSG